MDSRCVHESRLPYQCRPHGYHGFLLDMLGSQIPDLRQVALRSLERASKSLHRKGPLVNLVMTPARSNNLAVYH